jgi:tRNA(fMet)-specific endonuclease VapC
VAGYLLDTNVLSEVVKPQPSRKVIDRLRHLQNEELFTSVICLYEMRYGAARSRKKDELWRRLKAEVFPLVQILPLDPAAALLAADLRGQLERRGLPLGWDDLFIGATALVGNLIVVTRNVRHLRRLEPLVVEDWWA